MNPDVRREFERFSAMLPVEDSYKTQNALGIHEVLKAHFLIADYF